MQIFYDPKDGQVMAVYYNCQYSGNFWQEKGYIEAESEEKITRDMKVIVEEGKVVSFSNSENPVQPALPPKPETLEQLVEKEVSKQLAGRL